MKITVEMTDAEFLEFHEFQKEKSAFQQKSKAVSDRLEFFANKICWALGHDPKKPEKAKIIDQEHAQELLEMGEDFFRIKEIA